jgi:hypothetical protein
MSIAAIPQCSRRGGSLIHRGAGNDTGRKTRWKSCRVCLSGEFGGYRRIDSAAPAGAIRWHMRVGVLATSRAFFPPFSSTGVMPLFRSTESRSYASDQVASCSNGKPPHGVLETYFVHKTRVEEGCNAP